MKKLEWRKNPHVKKWMENIEKRPPRQDTNKGYLNRLRKEIEREFRL